jgi:type II secretory pathway pseudopilin PulG
VLEIVVVVASITVLIALLSSGGSRTMAIARATACRTNLRQLHTAAETYRLIEAAYPAAVLYYADNGSLRTAAWDFDHHGDGTIKPGPIWGYLDADSRVLQCPDFRGESTFGNDPATGYNYNTTYIGAEGRFPYLDENGRVLEGWDHCRRGVPAAAQRRSASVVIFGDGGWSNGANKFMRAPSNTVEVDLGLICAGAQAFRHHNCTNCVFLDGHSECREQAHEGEHTTQDLLEEIMDFPRNGFLSEDDSAYDPR